MAEPNASEFGADLEAELPQRHEQMQQLILDELKAIRALLARDVEAGAVIRVNGSVQ